MPNEEAILEVDSKIELDGFSAEGLQRAAECPMAQVATGAKNNDLQLSTTAS